MVYKNGLEEVTAVLNPDTAGPFSTIEKIPAHPADYEEEFPASDDVLEEQEIEEVDPATIDPSELA